MSFNFGGSPVLSNGSDFGVNDKQFPGIFFSAFTGESNAVYCVLREINGSQWLVQNADFVGSQWTLQNPSLPGVAMVLSAGSATLSLYNAPANSAPGFSWTLIWTSTSALVQPWYYIGNYGAVGDGVHNDLPAFNSAVSAANAAGGGTVLLGGFTYLFNAMAEVNVPNVNVMGLGAGITIVKQGFTCSPTNFALMYMGPSCDTNEVSNMTLQDPGVDIGTNPGLNYGSTFNFGTGWGFLATRNERVKATNVICDRTWHGFGSILFSEHSFSGCKYNDAQGHQLNNCVPSRSSTTPNYGFYAQGPSGIPNQGQYTLSGSPGVGNNLQGILQAGPGPDGDTPDPVTVNYTLGSADTSPAATALNFINAINESDAVSGPDAWLQPLTPANVSGSVITMTYIDVGPADGGTFTASATGGGIGISPTAPTAFTGGAGGYTINDSHSGKVLKHSQVWSVQGNIAQAGFKPDCNTGHKVSYVEGVHIDGGVTSASVQVGETDNGVGIRVARVNTQGVVSSQNYIGALPNLISLGPASIDHTKLTANANPGSVLGIANAAVSIEDCARGWADGLAVIATSAPQDQCYAISVSPNCTGSFEFRNCTGGNNASGGFGMGGTGSILLIGCRVHPSGTHNNMSAFNAYGPNSGIGPINIYSNQLGPPQGGNKGGPAENYGIDLLSKLTGGTPASQIQSVDIAANTLGGQVGTINTSLAQLGNLALNNSKIESRSWSPVDTSGSGLGVPTIATGPTQNPYCDSMWVAITPNTDTLSSIVVQLLNSVTQAAGHTVYTDPGAHTGSTIVMVPVPTNGFITLNGYGGGGGTHATWQWINL